MREKQMANRILIIEDEEKIARFIELELIHEGYEAEKCGDGRTGLELAEGGDFSLVLLDIMLPGLNGLEVLRRLRKSSDVPVACVYSIPVEAVPLPEDTQCTIT